MSTPARIAVLGAGLMGHAIAQVFAAAGHAVAVYDPAASSLATLHTRIAANLRQIGGDATALTRVRLSTELHDAVHDADFIVEAALEDLAVKQDLLAQAESLALHNPVIASNTSVIPITRIMQGLQRRGRALGTHWWNPPFLIPLVEVIGTEWTDPDCLQWTMSLHEDIGKTPVHVRRDVPGFIGNRLQHALWREAIALVQAGVCDARTVDTVVKSSFGLRSAVLGPLENADLVGTDLTAAIHQLVLPDLDRSEDVQPYLVNLVADGKLGMKADAGFHTWNDETKARLRARLTRHLIQCRTSLAELDADSTAAAAPPSRAPSEPRR
ncbi:MAG: 3-hydroxyacyl-CoA dehydrogenase family protein [Proteobacteria bacterium]|nr:3-hydroxyacyl-CoA dehydrogenase family protein [Pseudomonadota bacterium]